MPLSLVRLVGVLGVDGGFAWQISVSQVFPSCAYGMADPATGEPWLKQQAFASNRDISCLRRQCTCVSHGRVEGAVDAGARQGESRTTISGEYPAALCEALAEIVLKGA